MVADSLITARVTSEMKERFRAVACYQGLSENNASEALGGGGAADYGCSKTAGTGVDEPAAVGGKISVRLRTDDLLLLRERAKARAMPMSTYVAPHPLTPTVGEPLPTAELDVLKRSVAEIGAIARNLNQIARTVNQGEGSSGANKAHLQALPCALNGMRVHIKSLINSNLESWRSSDEKASP